MEENFNPEIGLRNYTKPLSIEGVEILTPTIHNTEDGSFSELARFANMPELQVNISQLQAGYIKAWHYHKQQTDYFYPVNKLMIGLIDNREKSTTYKVKMRFPLKQQILKIPPGVFHAIWNNTHENATLIYFVDKFFDGTDEFESSWDMIGKDFFAAQFG